MSKILIVVAAVVVIGAGWFFIARNSPRAQYASAGGTDTVTGSILKASLDEQATLGDGSEEATAATADDQPLDDLTKSYDENSIQ